MRLNLVNESFPQTEPVLLISSLLQLVVIRILFTRVHGSFLEIDIGVGDSFEEVTEMAETS